MIDFHLLPGGRRLDTGTDSSRFSPGRIALIYARLGQKDKALACLEKAKREDAPSLSDSGFESLRTHPRFKVLQARLVKASACAAY